MEEDEKIIREFLGTVYPVKDGKVLLTFNKKVQKFVPLGGHTDENELPCECAVREAKEESGYDVELVDANDFKTSKLPQNLTIGLDIIKPNHHHINIGYVGRVVGGEELKESDEGTELRWFSREELGVIEDLIDNVREASLKAIEIVEKLSE
jgi:ADP-ribose pyrophosphatase YjhB (NUDIX family)